MKLIKLQNKQMGIYFFFFKNKKIYKKINRFSGSDMSMLVRDASYEPLRVA